MEGAWQGHLTALLRAAVGKLQALFEAACATEDTIKMAVFFEKSHLSYDGKSDREMAVLPLVKTAEASNDCFTL